MMVLVLGGAVSGRAAVRLAVRLGHDVVVHDRDPTALAGIDAAAVHAGEWDDAALRGVDLAVTSPGLPERSPAVQAVLTSGVPLISELEFAAQHAVAPYVAITGTNGKTTVTEATAAMLQAGGVRSVAAGNVGLAFSDVALEPYDCFAVEASSFQLRFIEHFHPRAAAILNVAPDHLDWHGDFAAYAAAKGRIAENQTAADTLVFGADDPVATELAAAAPSRTIPVAGDRRPPGGNGPEGDRLIIGRQQFPRPALDAVWLFDLVAAASLADAVGAAPDGIAQALTTFRPGRHRRTVVAQAAGVTWINDSKATNPHAAMASAGAYESVVLIAGGRNKGLDLAPLVAVPTVRHVIALGEAAPELARTGGRERVTVVADMDEAVAAAAAMAQPGDTVLLAPGCASFDMFESYGERGDAFTALVTERVGVDHGA